MKKIFTLMLAVGLVGLASAQPANQRSISFDNKKEAEKFGGDYSRQPAFEKGKSTGYETNSFSTKEKDAQIQRINREYDQKISAVKKNWHMRPQEKSKQIRALENQRSQEIAAIQLRWEASNHRYDGRGQNKNSFRH